MTSIKNKYEIELMKRSGKILSKVILEAKKFSVSGRKTKEIDEFIEDLILKNNAKPSFKNFHGYSYSSCLSVNDELVHTLPSDRVLKDGDILTIDAGVLYQGLHTDAAITFGIGKISDSAKSIIDITQASLDNCLKYIKPDAYIGDAQAEIQKTIEDAGYYVIRDLCGHGIGRRLQEGPSIPNYGKPNTGFVLKEGMTICIEPMAAIGTHKINLEKDKWTITSADGSLTAHSEYTLLVTKNGVENLTKFY